MASVSFEGPVELGGIRVLGKGYAGVVVAARMRGREVALKIRRTDSPRRGMAHEASMLRAANAAGAGPRLISHSRNFIAMELVRGEPVGRWAASLRGRGSAAAFRGMARGTLEACRRLDEAGLDHGELSRITKHVIVSGAGPVIIDFEGASRRRRASNVTSAAQSLYVGSGIARDAARVCRVPPRDRIIGALREYRRDQSPAGFAGLLGALGV